MYTINTRVIDNDDKGENGRGTVYFMQVLLDGVYADHAEWGLLEELAGRFDSEAFKRPYLEANAKLGG